MQAPLAACRQPAGSYNRLPMVLNIERNIFWLIHASYAALGYF